MHMDFHAILLVAKIGAKASGSPLHFTMRLKANGAAITRSILEFSQTRERLVTKPHG
jgi:hypothetical protein